MYQVWFGTQITKSQPSKSLVENSLTNLKPIKSNKKKNPHYVNYLLRYVTIETLHHTTTKLIIFI